MKENSIITPITDLIANNKTEQSTEHRLSVAVDKLTDEFIKALGKGKVKLTKASDFTNIVNSFMVIQEYKKLNTNIEEVYDDKLHDLVDESDNTIQELYAKLFEAYNTDNDEKNRGD